jgi:hypothetical protein
MGTGWKKTGPEQQGPGPVRVHSPALPGYPLLGCSSAEPNSVSPGNMKHNLQKPSVTSKPAKRAHRLLGTATDVKSS